MDVVLKDQVIPETGLLTLSFQETVSINISAAEAQRRVSRFVHWEISSQMHGETPTLVLGQRAGWQVPIHLTFPSFGDVGCVGEIVVDAETGELHAPPDLIAEIKRRAQDLAARFTSPAKNRS